MNFRDTRFRDTLAAAMCDRALQHSGGTGRHDAARWGPCSLHEEAADALLASGVIDVRASKRVVDALTSAAVESEEPGDTLS